MARARHRPRGGSRRVHRARHRRSVRKSSRPWRENSDRPCRRRHWRVPRPAQSGPRPYRIRLRHPVRPPEWRSGAPRGASRPGASADKPWRFLSRQTQFGRLPPPEGVFSILDDLGKSTEEVNNYSDRMTRRNCHPDRLAEKILREAAASGSSGGQSADRFSSPPAAGAAQNEAGDNQVGGKPDRDAQHRGKQAKREGYGERRQLESQETAGKAEAHEIGDRDRQHHHVVPEEIGRDEERSDRKASGLQRIADLAAPDRDQRDCDG